MRSARLIVSITKAPHWLVDALGRSLYWSCDALFNSSSTLHNHSFRVTASRRSDAYNATLGQRGTYALRAFVISEPPPRLLYLAFKALRRAHRCRHAG